MKERKWKSKVEERSGGENGKGVELRGESDRLRLG